MTYALLTPERLAAWDEVGYEPHAGSGTHISCRADMLGRAMRGLAEFGESCAHFALEGFTCPPDFEVGREWEACLRLAKWEEYGVTELAVVDGIEMPPSREEWRWLKEHIEVRRKQPHWANGLPVTMAEVLAMAECSPESARLSGLLTTDELAELESVTPESVEAAKGAAREEQNMSSTGDGRQGRDNG